MGCRSARLPAGQPPGAVRSHRQPCGQDFTHTQVYYLREAGRMGQPSCDGSPGSLPMKPVRIVVGALAMTLSAAAAPLFMSTPAFAAPAATASPAAPKLPAAM